MNPQEYDGDDVTILLVDDDESHVELARINIERAGVTNPVIHFSSGHRVLEFLSNEIHPDNKNRFVMLLDINMPGMNGHQVLDQVKNDERTQNIPVIMLTTATSDREVERCYALGCNMYMVKPVGYEEFSETMRELGLFMRKSKIPGPSRLVS